MRSPGRVRRTAEAAAALVEDESGFSDGRSLEVSIGADQHAREPTGNGFGFAPGRGARWLRRIAAFDEEERRPRLEAPPPGKEKTLSEPIVIRPGRMALTDWRAIYRGGGIALDETARGGVDAGAATVETIVAIGEPVYGINTGFGKLASVRIEAADLAQLQRNLVLSHAAGVGEPLPVAVVRLAMALKAASLGQGASGAALGDAGAPRHLPRSRPRSRHPGAGLGRRLRRPRAVGPPLGRPDGRGGGLRRRAPSAGGRGPRRHRARGR